MERSTKVRLLAKNRFTAAELTVTDTAIETAGTVRYEGKLYNYSCLKNSKGAGFVAEFVEVDPPLDLTPKPGLPERVRRARGFAMAEMPDEDTKEVLDRWLADMQKEGESEDVCVRMLLSVVYDGLAFGNWPGRTA